MSDKETQEYKQALDEALEEMENNKLVLLKRGDLFQGKEELYKESMSKFSEAKSRLEEGESKGSVQRDLEMNWFNKHESFFMDLFETHSFPLLFELFELE